MVLLTLVIADLFSNATRGWFLVKYQETHIHVSSNCNNFVELLGERFRRDGSMNMICDSLEASLVPIFSIHKCGVKT